MCSALVPSRGLCRIFAYRTRHTQCVVEGHERLLLKLDRYGIDGQLQLWFRDFLTNRKHRVQIRGSYSERSPVISGVPQGSILGPIMFLIYVNDIPYFYTAKLFADDTKIYREINKVEDPIALQSDLTTLDLWADLWQVKFNSSKCEVMKITHNKDKSTPQYQVSGTELRNVFNYKDLKVIMASDLTWKKTSTPSFDRSWNTLARCGHHI